MDFPGRPIFIQLVPERECLLPQLVDLLLVLPQVQEAAARKAAPRAGSNAALRHGVARLSAPEDDAASGQGRVGAVVVHHEVGGRLEAIVQE